MANKVESRFPEARYAIARLLVLLAWHALPRNADWPKERLWTVNSSIKTTLETFKTRGRS